MKRIIFLSLTVILAVGSAMAASAEAVPVCDYDQCPGGSVKCCTQGGVTLYNGNSESIL